jgi:hypothetical protein
MEKRIRWALLAAVLALGLAADPCAAGPLAPRWDPGRLPVHFIQNQGQIDPSVKYYQRGKGYVAYFTRDGIVFALQSVEGEQGRLRREVLRMTLAGMNPEAELVALDPQEHTVNYLRGSDSSQWRTRIPTYRTVRYREVYPGIDLVFYGRDGALEYDFVVKPGADPGEIRVAYSGARELRLNPGADLVIELPGGGELVQKKPLLHQEIGGVKVRREGAFALQRDAPFVCRFEVASYDSGHALIIDPVMVYSTFLGGSFDDHTARVAVDAAGQAYVTGVTASDDFPVESAFQDTRAASADAFVAKLSADGASLIYSTYLGGSSDDSGHGIAVDQTGHAYVIGKTRSTDFPTTPGVLQATLNGFEDAFVAKLSADGASLVYSTYLGGSSVDVGLGIALDPMERVHVTGYTDSDDFRIVPGAPQSTRRGSYDVFVARLNDDATALSSSTYLGGSGSDMPRSIAVDHFAAVHLVGDALSLDFPTTQMALQPSKPGGGSDGFVAKLGPSGTFWVYVTYLGGTDNDWANGVAASPAGETFVAGSTSSSDFPTTPGALYTAIQGGTDAYVAKLSVDGASMLYSTYLGGEGNDYGLAIAVTRSGRAVVTGETRSFGFPLTPDALQSAKLGLADGFVSILDASGASLAYSTYLGGNNPSLMPVERGHGVAVHGTGAIYVSGETPSPDFPTTPGAFQTTLGGLHDAFVTQLSDILPVPLDLRPRRCPNLVRARKAKRLKVALLGTPSFDVAQIDTASLRLSRDEEPPPNQQPAEAAPTKIAYKDVTRPYLGEPGGCAKLRKDKQKDLLLYFDTQTLVQTLGLQPQAPTPLILRGYLKKEHGGLPFWGRDTITLAP